MGAWGHGNFEDDTSIEHLSIVVDGLLEVVRRLCEEPSDIDAGDYDTVAAVANIEIIACLGESLGRISRSGKPPSFELPSSNSLRQWQMVFLTRYGEACREIGMADEFREKRMNAVSDAFCRLITLAE